MIVYLVVRRTANPTRQVGGQIQCFDFVCVPGGSAPLNANILEMWLPSVAGS
jgi:hypothetical protein